MKIVWHVFTRTFALVVMGLLTVNFGDAFSAAGTGLSRGNYAMLMVLGFFLVWNVYPRTESVWKKRGILLLQFSGAALLIWLAVIFRGSDGSGFAIRWWGILGRIGWTYLFCTLVFLAVGKRLAAHVVVTVLLVAGALLQASGLVPGNILPNQLTIFAFGSTGVLLSLLVERYADVRAPGVSIGSPCPSVWACSLRALSPTASGSSPNSPPRRPGISTAARSSFRSSPALLSDRCAGTCPLVRVGKAGRYGSAVVLRGGLCVESVEEPDLFRSAASSRIFGRDSGTCQFVPLRAVAHLDRLAVGPRRGEAQNLILPGNVKKAVLLRQPLFMS